LPCSFASNNSEAPKFDILETYPNLLIDSKISLFAWDGLGSNTLQDVALNPKNATKN
jgi:hypothetical protein